MYNRATNPIDSSQATKTVVRSLFQVIDKYPIMYQHRLANILNYFGYGYQYLLTPPPSPIVGKSFEYNS